MLLKSFSVNKVSSISSYKDEEGKIHVKAIYYNKLNDNVSLEMVVSKIEDGYVLDIKYDIHTHFENHSTKKLYSDEEFIVEIFNHNNPLLLGSVLRLERRKDNDVISENISFTDPDKTVRVSFEVVLETKIVTEESD